MSRNERLIFRSERLVYKAVENTTEDKAVLSSLIHTDADGLANVATRLSRSFNTADALKYLPDVDAQLLFVKACLPSTETAEDGSTKEKLTPIGIMLLDGAASPTRHNRTSTVGITFGRQWQGQGYGTEGLNWLLDWGFRVANLHSIRLIAYSHNHRAIKFYESLGFHKDGI